MASSTVKRDPNTLSNYDNWLSMHITANLAVLFDQSKLAGNVTHRLKSRTHSASREIFLDTDHLDIGRVTVNGQPAEWELLPPQAPFGRALKINMQDGAELDEIVEVDVCTLSPISGWSISL